MYRCATLVYAGLRRRSPSLPYFNILPPSPCHRIPRISRAPVFLARRRHLHRHHRGSIGPHSIRARPVRVCPRRNRRFRISDTAPVGVHRVIAIFRREFLRAKSGILCRIIPHIEIQRVKSVIHLVIKGRIIAGSVHHLDECCGCGGIGNIWRETAL